MDDGFGEKARCVNCQLKRFTSRRNCWDKEHVSNYPYFWYEKMLWTSKKKKILLQNHQCHFVQHYKKLFFFNKTIIQPVWNELKNKLLCKRLTVVRFRFFQKILIENIVSTPFTITLFTKTASVPENSRSWVHTDRFCENTTVTVGLAREQCTYIIPV